jgi:hypothetical protein
VFPAAPAPGAGIVPDPPPPDPPVAEAILLLPDPPLPPPVLVILEKIEFDPELLVAPPAPTVIGYAVAPQTEIEQQVL